VTNQFHFNKLCRQVGQTRYAPDHGVNCWTVSH